jgi:glycerol-3-phosphate responsive antiterminator
MINILLFTAKKKKIHVIERLFMFNKSINNPSNIKIKEIIAKGS